ncbi:mannosyltransferase putative-domain-containing protein [Zopfochytrium polystomum]|nr:mannosyltransferase putative-domain-containing protein [Zopfochytrium polystomum]
MATDHPLSSSKSGSGGSSGSGSSSNSLAWWQGLTVASSSSSSSWSSWSSWSTADSSASRLLAAVPPYLRSSRLLRRVLTLLALALVLFLSLRSASSSLSRYAQEYRDALQRSKWIRYLEALKPYNPHAVHWKPGSRGVVLTGHEKSAPNAVMAAMFLREMGCELPVAFAYLRDQISEGTLAMLSSQNITLVDMTHTIQLYDWGERELTLGGPKVDAILSAPFQQVLFLDPDVMPLVDPNLFFDSKTFDRYGAIFWPDFNKRPKDSGLWKTMDLEDEYFDGQEIESGIIFIDKMKTWTAIKLTQHLAAEAKYYFNYFWGDKELFFWGWKASGTPFFMVPHYLQVVGQLINDTHPRGGIRLLANASSPTKVSIPSTAKFCGLNMLQLDFKDGDDDDASDLDNSYVPKPAFMHWNGVKHCYGEDLEPFAVARTYVAPVIGETVRGRDGLNFFYLGDYLGLKHCVDLVEREDLVLKTWNFTETAPHLSPLFHRIYKSAHALVNKTKTATTTRLK